MLTYPGGERGGGRPGAGWGGGGVRFNHMIARDMCAASEVQAVNMAKHCPKAFHDRVVMLERYLQQAGRVSEVMAGCVGCA